VLFSLPHQAGIKGGAKVKRWLGVLVLLLGAGAARGAWFEYYGGGFHAFSDVWAWAGGYQGGPYYMTSDGIFSAQVEL